MLKILIILVYFERPKLIKNALNSIKELNYDNWELAFIDDGSVKYPGRPIVEDILKDNLSKVKFYNSHDTVAKKIEQGGSRHGFYMTLATLESESEIALVLCDDDALTKDYLTGINKFFTENPSKYWGYSHIIRYDPTSQDYHTVAPTPNEWLNRFTIPISPACNIDSSQVVWKVSCTKSDGIYWNYPQTGALDADFYSKMYAKYGNCDFMNCIGQYKGVFSDQMGNRAEILNPKDDV